MSEKVQALVRYYAREGYARQLQTVCQEVLKKKSNEPVLVFWKAYGLLMEGNAPEVGLITIWEKHMVVNRACMKAQTKDMVEPDQSALCTAAPCCICVVQARCTLSLHTTSPTTCRCVQALRELRSVAQVPELELAVAAAMVQAHESAKVVDQDAVMELQTRLEVRTRAGVKGAFFACMHVGAGELWVVVCTIVGVCMHVWLCASCVQSLSIYLYLCVCACVCARACVIAGLA